MAFFVSLLNIHGYVNIEPFILLYITHWLGKFWNMVRLYIVNTLN